MELGPPACRVGVASNVNVVEKAGCPTLQNAINGFSTGAENSMIPVVDVKAIKSPTELGELSTVPSM